MSLKCTLHMLPSRLGGVARTIVLHPAICAGWQKEELYEKLQTVKKGVPSAESSRSVRGLGKGVSGKPYPRLCDARRPRLEPGTFRSQAVRLYRLHQARPSKASNSELIKLIQLREFE